MRPADRPARPEPAGAESAKSASAVGPAAAIGQVAFTVAVDDNDPFDCMPDTSVLVAMGRQRIRTILAGCHGGGCGICRIKVLEGSYECGRMSRAHVTEEAQAEGVALACRTYPRSDLRVTPHPLWPSLRAPAS